MRAWRVNTKFPLPYCNFLYNIIRNNSWKITVYYTFTPPPNIFTGGDNDGYSSDIAKDALPLLNVYRGGDGDGYASSSQ